MKVIPRLSDTVKGILLIISGTIILVNVLGFSAKIIHNIVLFGSITMIIIGFLMADLHKRIYRLIVKNEKPQAPQQPQHPFQHDAFQDKDDEHKF